MDHDVFLSYATKDEGLARSFVEILEKKGIRCWFAPRDNVHGERFGGGIVQAIDRSLLFVIILSQASDASDYVIREVAAACKRRIPILVYQVEDFTASADIAFYLESIHWFKSDKSLQESIPEFAKIASESLRAQRVRELDARLPAQPLFGRDEDVDKILDKLSRDSLIPLTAQIVNRSSVSRSDAIPAFTSLSVNQEKRGRVERPGRSRFYRHRMLSATHQTCQDSSRHLFYWAPFILVGNWK